MANIQVPGLRQLGHLRHVCFKLFDQSPHAFGKVTKWSASKDEFTKRTAERLAASENATARWIGRDALKDLKRLA